MATHDNNNMKLGSFRKGPKKVELRRWKNEQRLSSAQAHRVYVQVVSAGSRDSPPSLYVFAEHRRYLFNCGEGTQRLMMEHRLKLTALGNIFVSRVSWDRVGGLSGLILTMRDVGVPEILLHGPTQLEKFVEAIKTFCGPLEDIRLGIQASPDSTYSDNTMTVHQVPVFGKRGSGVDPSPVVAFVCELHPKKGKLLVPEARALGLPLGTAALGPLVEQLKSGKSVVYEGKEIRPEQVCSPSIPGPVFLVLDCPSEEVMDGLCSDQTLRRHLCGGAGPPADLVVHMTPESVLNTDRYRDWMDGFSSSTQHLILNEQVRTHHNVRCHKFQTHLNLIHPEIFPQLRSYTSQEPAADLPTSCVRAECLLKFQLTPVKEWQRDAIPPCDTQEFVKEASQVPNFMEEVEKCRRLREEVAQPQPPAQSALKGQEQQHPEVVFLGTGSAIPMTIRNVSSTLVNISRSQSLLLDCGEGTFGQLCRHYGRQVDEALANISTVFISHMHADHHTGLLNVLFQRERALLSLGRPVLPVHLVAPTQMMTWLHQYHSSCEEILQHVRFISSLSLSPKAPPPQRGVSLISELLEQNELLQFQTCSVRHISGAFACSFTHTSGWKLVFSGDTMPCNNLVTIGANATLLIHEATLEDGLEDEALDKRHSTTSQAIRVGEQMKAQFLILNHFSQRYAKIPVFSAACSDRVGVAFDHMRVSLSDLQTLPSLSPALKTLFALEIEELEEKKEKREQRRGGGGAEDPGLTEPRAAKRQGAESPAGGAGSPGGGGDAKRHKM